MFEWIGWVATAVFAVSYFCRQPALLRRTQALAAVLWIGYGLIIKAPPVIVANVAVAAIALFSSFRHAVQQAVQPAEVPASRPFKKTSADRTVCCTLPKLPISTANDTSLSGEV